MQGLSAQEMAVMLVALGVLIGMSRLLGELARSIHQPAVLGELLAGVLLGPTVLGAIWPVGQTWMFPLKGPNALVLDGISTLAIVLFLMVAGMEVNLAVVLRQGRSALKIGFLGTLFPFVLGLLAAWTVPQLLGRAHDADSLIFALFIATAMSISALPVIAKTLLDLNLYRTDLGMIIVSAAIFNDLIGWTIFAIILGMLGTHGVGFSVPVTIALTFVFAGLMLTVGRWCVHRVLPVLQAYTHWPGGVLGFAVACALLGAAVTELIGIHAIFGSFVVGVALGSTHHLQERTRVLIEEFVSFIFAPVFFASIGLRVNFLTDFDLSLVSVIFVLACLGKLIGATGGALWGGLPSRDAWAVGLAMNARGAMEIILGLLALEAGVINQRLFVALVVMAIGTSALSGPLMRFVLMKKQPLRLQPLFSSRFFQPSLAATSRRQAIRELTTLACQQSSLDPQAIEQLAWGREEMEPTGIGNGVAIPHARVVGLTTPIVAVGLSHPGIDFDSPDGQPTHLIFLLLTPANDPTVQLEVSALIAEMFRDPSAQERVLRARNHTEFLAVLKTLAPKEIG